MVPEGEKPISSAESVSQDPIQAAVEGDFPKLDSRIKEFLTFELFESARGRLIAWAKWPIGVAAVVLTLLGVKTYFDINSGIRKQVEATVAEKVKAETDKELTKARQEQEHQLDRFRKQSDEALKTLDAAVKEVTEKKGQAIERFTALAPMATLPNNNSSNIDPRARHRPIGRGLSVGGELQGVAGAGTVCCIVKDKSRPKYLLTVPWIVGVNSTEKTSILQPAPLDGGKPGEDEIAYFSQQVKLDFQHANRSVGALAKLKPDVRLYYDIPGLGKITGIADAKVDDVVVKYGRTTGLTRGRIGSH